MEKSSILFNGKVLVIDPILSKLIGLNESIILKQIDYWVTYNEQMGNFYNDGYYWTTSSVRAWQERDFPFWSVDTIKRILKKLEQMGLIVSGQFNQNQLNRTKWYRVNHEKLKEYEEEYQKIKHKKFKHKLENEENSKELLKYKNNDNINDNRLVQNASMVSAKCTNRENADKVSEINANTEIDRLVQNAPMLYKEEYIYINKADNKKERADIEEIKNYWNQELKDTPIREITALSKSRLNKIKSRLKEHTLEEIKTAIDKIKASSFLQGQGDKGWIIKFDWLFENDNNIIKVLEGNYDERTPPRNKLSGFNFTEDRQTDGMTEDELKALVGWNT